MPSQWQGPRPELEPVRQLLDEMDGQKPGDYMINSGGMQQYTNILGTSLTSVERIVNRNRQNEVLFLELGERAATRLIVDTYSFTVRACATELTARMQRDKRPDLKLVSDD